MINPHFPSLDISFPTNEDVTARPIMMVSVTCLLDDLIEKDVRYLG